MAARSEEPSVPVGLAADGNRNAVQVAGDGKAYARQSNDADDCNQTEDKAVFRKSLTFLVPKTGLET